jgi:hypothetical protein
LHYVKKQANQYKSKILLINVFHYLIAKYDYLIDVNKLFYKVHKFHKIYLFHFHYLIKIQQFLNVCFVFLRFLSFKFCALWLCYYETNIKQNNLLTKFLIKYLSLKVQINSTCLVFLE